MTDPPGRAEAGPGPPRTDPTAGPGLEPAVEPAAPDRGWGPAALLRAEREIVPFTGRAAERAALRDWCFGLAPHSVRVLLGAAGVGKTRLVRQVAADWAAQAEPWRVVEPGDEPHAAAAAAAAGPGRPLLIVDEAESRAGLAALLEAALTGPGEARVLLVARALGDWWDLLAEDCPPAVAGLLTEAPPVRLDSPLTPEVTDAEVTVAAVPYFAAAMSLELRGQPEIERSAMRLPVLLLHAAALAAVLRAAADGETAVRVVVGPWVLDELLDHELRYWQRSAAAAGLEYHAEPVTHAVTMATLAGPHSVADAEAALARVPYLTGVPTEGRAEWARWLAGLYPPGPNGRVGGLRPEPVAQTLVVRLLAGDPVLTRRFTRALPPDQATHAMTVLASACADHPEAIGLLREALAYDLPSLAGPAALVAQQVPGVLPGLLRDAVGNAPAAPDSLTAIARGWPRPSLAVAEPGLIAMLRARASLAATSLAAAGPAGLGGLAEWDDRAADVLRWLDGRDLPQPEPAASGGVAARLADPRDTGPPGQEWPGGAQFGVRQTAASRARDRQAELASALTDLAARCSERDRPQDARRAEQQAVRIYRNLAASEPDRYRPELAVSLANLGVWQAAVTGPAGAVPPTLEAAGLLRDLAAADPAQYRPELVTCLGNLGIWYTRAGQPAEAVSAELEASSILRELAAADPGQFQAELAASLTNLGISYSRAGRATEALPVEQEAASIQWELAAAEPGRYRADLASSLTNLVITQAELGDLAEAASAAQDAVTVYRDLAVVDPARYRRDLARALVNLGIRQSELGRTDAAVGPLHEAVSIRRGLAAIEPDRDRAGLARSLASLAAVLTALERHDEARAARAEAEALTAGPGTAQVADVAPEPAGSRPPPVADDPAQETAAAGQPAAERPARPAAATGSRSRAGPTGQQQPGKPRRASSGKRRQTSPGERRQTSPGESRQTSPGERRQTSPGESRQPGSRERRQPVSGERRAPASGEGRQPASGARRKASSGGSAQPPPADLERPAGSEADEQHAEAGRGPAQRRKQARTRQGGRTPTAGG